MTFRARRWTRLSVALAAGTALTTASLAHAGESTSEAATTRLAWWIFGGEGEGEGQKNEGQSPKHPEAHPKASSGGEGEGEGSGGQGGEGEGAAVGAADLATDDVAYLSTLSLVRGHLLAGMELYRAGEALAAEAHMRHPAGELYGPLAPALTARKAEGFAGDLDRLAGLAQSRALPETVEAAYMALLARLDAAGAVVTATPAKSLAVAANLLKAAAEEYDVAVEDDGTVADAVEYQDAYGFTQEARRLLSGLEGTEAAEALAIVDGLHILWPALVPPKTLSTDPSLLHGAAAKVEILALGVR